MTSHTGKTASNGVRNINQAPPQSPIPTIQAPDIEIRTIEVVGVPTAKILGTRIAIGCNSMPRRFKTSKYDGKQETSHRWEANLLIRPSATSEKITFQLLRTRRFRKAKVYASVEIEAAELIIEHSQGM
uniref:Uncharacterized protein n=1 Tax=Moniliophthora roreri TaxID=221103 RepID=A0A0W0G8E6_MONRR